MDRKPELEPSDKHSVSASAMRQMFGRIVRRYDLLNRVISLGQDQRWRREAVSRLGAGAGEWALDLGAGTGDLALELVRQQPGARAVAVDFTLPMLQHARRRREAGSVRWVLADAARLPFRDGAFAAMVSGFLLRNLPDIDGGLAEQLRTLRGGGRWVALDTTPSRSWLVRLHLRVIGPRLGWLLAGDAAAYRYLDASTRAFLTAEQVAERLRMAGLSQVNFVRRMLGAAAIHWGVKPADPG